MNPVQDLISSLSADQGLIERVADQVALRKADAFTLGTYGQNVFGYNLDPVVEFLYPFLKNVPLVGGTMSSDGNFTYRPIPRVRSRGGKAAEWITITSLDPNQAAGGVGRGQRGAPMTMQSNRLSAPFYGLGVEVPVDFETQYESGDLLTPTPLAIASQSGLRALMIAEEKLVIGGNSSLTLAPPTVTVADGASTGGDTGSTFNAGTLSVIVVPLTNEGYLRSSVTSGVVTTIDRANIDGSTLSFGGGSGAQSAAGSASCSSGHTMLASVTPVSGAVAYAWYWGLAGSEKLGSITTLAGIEITKDAAGTQTAASLGSADHSKNQYVFDGFFTIMAGSSFLSATGGGSGTSSGSYILAQSNGAGSGSTAGKIGTGSTLTTDGAGGIKEFDTLLQDRWDNYRLGFTRILINSREAPIITRCILSTPSGTTSLFRASMDYNQGTLLAGRRITSYHNKFTGEDLDIIIHPWMPPGNIIFYSDTVPYPLSNVNNLVEFETRQGYYQIDWPLSTRQWQSGVYVDEALKHHFPPSMAWITNLGSVMA